jgi:glycine/D-amino acid oxidase-like deaminating enzyme
MVGSAIAYGLARRGQRVAVLDEGDNALRAARANFGLVWVQGKGDGMPAYARWSRRSADLWPDFADELKELTGIATEYRKPGGVHYCVGEADYAERELQVRRLHNQADIHELEMIDRGQLEQLMPLVRFGPDVTGASYCRHDGHTNPLALLRALHAGLKKLGAGYRPDAPARAVKHSGGEFVVDTPAGQFTAGKLVLAAGHGITALAPGVGLPAPIRPERGQVLVTERLSPFIPMPGGGIRQTEDGTVMIGATRENVGFDLSTTAQASSNLAARAIRIMPDLAKAKLVRTWAGIRVLSPDGHPVYLQSESCPGAFVAICHSGVTLAGAHAGDFAEAVVQGSLPEFFDDFHPSRFDVPQAA